MDRKRIVRATPRYQLGTGSETSSRSRSATISADSPYPVMSRGSYVRYSRSDTGRGARCVCEARRSPEFALALCRGRTRTDSGLLPVDDGELGDHAVLVTQRATLGQPRRRISSRWIGRVDQPLDDGGVGTFGDHVEGEISTGCLEPDPAVECGFARWCIEMADIPEL